MGAGGAQIPTGMMCPCKCAQLCLPGFVPTPVCVWSQEPWAHMFI